MNLECECDEAYVARHCWTWPNCRSIGDCDCWCGDCAVADALTVDAFLFEATNHSVYVPGELVEAVGIGKNDPRDDPGEFSPGMFIYGRGIDDYQPGVDEGECHWMYFRVGDLRPLTKAAERMHAELRRRNRHLPRHYR